MGKMSRVYASFEFESFGRTSIQYITVEPEQDVDSLIQQLIEIREKYGPTAALVKCEVFYPYCEGESTFEYRIEYDDQEANK